MQIVEPQFCCIKKSPVGSGGINCWPEPPEFSLLVQPLHSPRSSTADLSYTESLLDRNPLQPPLERSRQHKFIW
ncbi:hypothetical protein PM082_000139 [Marasmius tenuissimus]|nr:hypothetical protein PM082_000598 [Marasmius tenuissimus]KAJ8077938.1 hypothetical protein PM082_000139 [Marasmius tenuissimus]